jgi:hypothetical protein
MTVLAVLLPGVYYSCLILMLPRRHSTQMVWIDTCPVATIVVNHVTVRNLSDNKVVYGAMGESDVPAPVDAPIAIDQCAIPPPALIGKIYVGKKPACE